MADEPDKTPNPNPAPEAPKPEQQAAPEPQQVTPPAEEQMPRRGFFKVVGRDAAWFAAGALGTDYANGGNRHVDTIPMRIAGGTVGGISAVGVGYAIRAADKKKKKAEPDEGQGR